MNTDRILYFDTKVRNCSKILLCSLFLSTLLIFSHHSSYGSSSSQSIPVNETSSSSSHSIQTRFFLSNSDYGKLALLRNELSKIPLIKGSLATDSQGIIKQYEQDIFNIEYLLSKYAPSERTPSTNLALQAITIENELMIAVKNTIGLPSDKLSSGISSFFKTAAYEEFHHAMNRIWNYEMWKFEPTMVRQLEESTSRLSSELHEFGQVSLKKVSDRADKEAIKSAVDKSLSLLDALYQLTHRIVLDNNQQYKEAKVTLTALSEMVAGALVYRTLLSTGKTIFNFSKALFSKTKFGGVPAACILGMSGAVGFAESLSNFGYIFRAAGNAFIDPKTNFAGELFKIKEAEQNQFNESVVHSVKAGLGGGCVIATSSVISPALTATVVQRGVHIALYTMTLDFTASLLKAYNIYNKINAIESHKTQLSNESKSELVALKKELFFHLTSMTTKSINFLVLSILSKELKAEIPHALRNGQVDRQLGPVSDDFAGGIDPVQVAFGSLATQTANKIWRAAQPFQQGAVPAQSAQLSPSPEAVSRPVGKGSGGGVSSGIVSSGFAGAIKAGNSKVLDLRPINNNSPKYDPSQRGRVLNRGRLDRGNRAGAFSESKKSRYISRNN